MGNVREHLQVINAGCADKDLAYFKDKMADFNRDAHLTVRWDDRGSCALQGPGTRRHRPQCRVHYAPRR